MTTVRCSIADGVARITLARPPLNIVDIATSTALTEGIVGLAAAAPHVLVLAADGEHFSAGVDIGDHLPATVTRMLRAFHAAVRALLAFPAPTVAAVRGHCLGGGAELAIACDLVVIEETARLGFPEIALACFPPVAAALLPRLCGEKLALELMLTGRTLSAAEAVAAGLASRVAAPGALEDETARLVGELPRGENAKAGALLRRAATAAGRGETEERLAAAERIYLEELAVLPETERAVRTWMARRKSAPPLL